MGGLGIGDTAGYPKTMPGVVPVKRCTGVAPEESPKGVGTANGEYLIDGEKLGVNILPCAGKPRESTTFSSRSTEQSPRSSSVGGCLGNILLI